MRRLARHAVVGIACTIFCGSGAALASGGQFVCPSASTPACGGQPNYTCSILTSKRCTTNADCLAGEGTCTVRISGTVSTTSPRTITNIALSSATNLSLTASIPPSALSGTFEVTPTGPNGQGMVVATDDLGVTCTVDVSFRTRALSEVDDEEICPQFEGYSLRALAVSPDVAQPAGVSACATRLATCASEDNLPGGYEYQNGPSASRVLFVRSPIAGDVEMKMSKHESGYESVLQMFHSRSADLGVSYGAFALVPGQTSEPGSTVIRGTGQWSDVRVVTGVPLSSPPGGTILVPAWADWAKIVVLVLMLTSIIAFAWRHATQGDRTSRRP